MNSDIYSINCHIESKGSLFTEVNFKFKLLSSFIFVLQLLLNISTLSIKSSYEKYRNKTVCPEDAETIKCLADILHGNFNFSVSW